MKNSFLFGLIFLANTLLAHGFSAEFELRKSWLIAPETNPMEATFLMFKHEEVYLENAEGKIVHFPISKFSSSDQAFVKKKYAQIEQLNTPMRAAKPPETAAKLSFFDEQKMGVLGLVVLIFGGLFFLFYKEKRPAIVRRAMLGLPIFLLGFKPGFIQKMLGTDPNFVDSAFQPFVPAVKTHWDNDWFYVESKGIAEHKMMAGITNWQQQVPISQCYIGANAWQIPLNPVLAASPVPVNAQHFLRGAVAIAANGLPIFNPFTNTGVDAFLDGQLDDFGGHCGRADDYHYHTAPLHLDAKTPEILPIAFALDGFAVFGSLEPSGAAMLALDANHGHFDAGVYHYHGTPTAPYMIGNMVGKVTEDAMMQIIPQAKASPIRPAGAPLPGAKITDCVQNSTANGYILSYTKGGQEFSIDYRWPSAGKYDFIFNTPTGSTTQTFNGFAQCEVPTETADFSKNMADVVVFPNPTTGSFSLKMEELNAGNVRSISIFDLGGKLVFESKKFEPLLEISGFPSGVYFLKIRFGQGETVRKILVE